MRSFALQSAMSTRLPLAASESASAAVTVVLPTPPLPVTKTKRSSRGGHMTRERYRGSEARGQVGAMKGTSMKIVRRDPRNAQRNAEEQRSARDAAVGARDVRPARGHSVEHAACGLRALPHGRPRRHPVRRPLRGYRRSPPADHRNARRLRRGAPAPPRAHALSRAYLRRTDEGRGAPLPHQRGARALLRAQKERIRCARSAANTTS